MGFSIETRDKYLVIVLLITLLLFLPACSVGSTPKTTYISPKPYAFNVASKADTWIGIGNYLVDGNGMTLYYYSMDTPGESNVPEDMLVNWPIYYVPDIFLPYTLDAVDFNTIIRGDEKLQTTFRGWPLYYSVKDKNPGDILGQGEDNLWFVINPDYFPNPKSTLPTN